MSGGREFHRGVEQVCVEKECQASWSSTHCQPVRYSRGAPWENPARGSGTPGRSLLSSTLALSPRAYLALRTPDVLGRMLEVLPRVSRFSPHNSSFQHYALCTLTGQAAAL